MHVAVRGSQGLYMLGDSPKFGSDAEEKSGFVKDVAPNCKAMVFSHDGAKFAWSDGKKVNIAKWTPEGQWSVVCSLEASGRTTFLKFSPKGTALCSWEVFAKLANGKSTSDFPENNVRLWDSESGRLIYGYVHRKSEGWFPQWTDDEKFCAHRSPNNEVVFFADNRFQEQPLPHRLSIKHLDSFFVSPKAEGPLIACYLPGQKGAPGFCKLFVYPRFNPETDAVASKSFMMADKMEVKWSPTDGKSCLILAQSDVDKTGASYYGKTQLHFANAHGDTAFVQLPKDGPVYSVTWKPSKPDQFLVVYGFMPARATLFDKKCDVVFDLGMGPRNMATFNPQGNLAIVGGFGNLRGNIEVWDVEGKNKTSQFEATDATDLKWSPDGQHILTSTCAPRLRTGNGFRVWHYTSTLLHETVLIDTKNNGDQRTEKPAAIAAPTCDELWEVIWRPVPEGTFSQSFTVLDKPIAGGLTSITPQASKQAYRPPAARGKPPSCHDLPSVKKGTYRSARIPVGLVVEPKEKNEMSKSATKNKKRTRARKQQGHGNGLDVSQRDGVAALSSKEETPQTDAFDVCNAEKEKQLRKLQKKLADIEKLKTRVANGETLEANQLEKVQKESELIAMMKKLET